MYFGRLSDLVCLGAQDLADGGPFRVRHGQDVKNITAGFFRDQSGIYLLVAPVSNLSVYVIPFCTGNLHPFQQYEIGFYMR